MINDEKQENSSKIRGYEKHEKSISLDKTVFIVFLQVFYGCLHNITRYTFQVSIESFISALVYKVFDICPTPPWTLIRNLIGFFFANCVGNLFIFENSEKNPSPFLMIGKTNVNF